MPKPPEQLDGTTGGAIWLPTLFVIGALVASVVIPLVSYDRIDDQRQLRELLAQPAHDQINRLAVSLTLEISSFRGYLLTGDDEFIRHYRNARAAGEEARKRLETYMPAVAAERGSAPHLQRINLLLQQWHEGHQELFDGRISRDEYITGHIHRSQETFAEIAREINRMRSIVRAFDTGIRKSTMRAIRTGAIAMVSLVVLGLVAAMTVSRLSFRLEGSSVKLARRTREEAAFRAVASRLNAATNVIDVLRQVSESAVAITRADGAYVERVRPGREEVEVVAMVGEGTPEAGTVVAYPGSLTAEIVERPEPVVATTLASVGPAMAFYLSRTCDRCQLILVPLVSDHELMGALVVLAVDAKPDWFSDSDVRRGRMLGDLAALALRRASVLESEQQARRTAEEAVVAREEILGVVSHDLRAPLTTISLGLQMLGEGPAVEDIALLLDATRRMQRLVDDLLDIARIEQGRLSLDRTATGVPALAEDTCDAFMAAAQQKGIELVCHAAGTLPLIDADPDRLIQVLGNLISNAIKFTPEGGRIDVEAVKAGESVRFSVTDTGPGIPEPQASRMFHGRWQAKKTAHLGTGLGLAIARGIVEAHGGSIGLENPPGKGASFFFTIPATNA